MYNLADHFRDDRLGLDNRHDQPSHRWTVIFSSMDSEAIGEELPRPDSASLVRIHPLFVRDDMFIVYHQLHHHFFGICDCVTHAKIKILMLMADCAPPRHLAGKKDLRSLSSEDLCCHLGK